MTRSFLNLVARAVNIDPTTYPNDSKLEQAVIFALKTTVGDSVRATGTLTASGVFSNGNTVTIGGYVYTFRTALTVPAVPFEVLIGISAAVSLDNLQAAINAGAGAGTTYSTGTFAHPDVTATTNSDTTQVVQARLGGTNGNSIATTETGANSAWGAATLASGANGTFYRGQTQRDNDAVSGGANI